MKIGIKRLYQIAFMLVMIVCLGCLSSGTNKPTLVEAAPVNYLDEAGNWHIADLQVRDTTAYYRSLQGLTGEAFVNKLSGIISNGVTRIPYGGKEGQTGSKLKEIERHPNDKNNVYLMYSGASRPKSNLNVQNADGWNQEHTWAKSHGFPKDTIGENWNSYSDLHHLRATFININSTRSNLDFDEVENHSQAAKEIAYGNKVIGNTCFEPRDAVKGDIARIMMYMDVRYAGSPNLTLVEEIPTPSKVLGNGSFGKLSTLLKWHNEDPVDDFERRRNEDVQDIQGNRNPFIDHPEFIEQVYGVKYTGETGGGDETPPSKEDKEKADAVSNLISNIGYVTLQSEEAILHADAEYQTLTATQKKLVTNYYLLVQAKIDLEKIKSGENIPSTVVYSSNFSNSTSPNTNSYEKDKTIELESKQWYFSGLYKSSGDVRLGYNADSSINRKFGGLQSSKGSSLEMSWDIDYAHSISMQFGKSYGEISQTLVYFSSDKGVSYQLIQTIKGAPSNLDAFLSIPTTGRFALVISGTKNPRLELGKVELKQADIEVSSATDEFEKLNTQASLYFKYAIKSENNYEIKDASIRFGSTISKTLYDNLLDLDVQAEFGVLVIPSAVLDEEMLNHETEGVVKQVITPIQVAEPNAKNENKDGLYYQFAFVITEIPKEAWRTNFVAVSYVKINGEYYYMSAVEHSFYSIVEEYVDDPRVTEHKDVLEYLVFQYWEIE